MAPSARIEAYRKAAAKLSTKLTPAARGQLGNELERAISDAPASAFSIPESVRFHPSILKAGGASPSSIPHNIKNSATMNDSSIPGAVIRPNGTSRLAYLLQPSLTPTEIDGLAYRIRTLSSNDGINSIIIANPLEDPDEEGNCIPSFLDEEERSLRDDPHSPWGQHFPNPVKNLLDSTLEHDALFPIPYVTSGYDPKSVYSQGLHSDPHQLERRLLLPLMELTAAVRGTHHRHSDDPRTPSRIPTISLPHGLVTDGGYSLLSSSYVLATRSSSYSILHPLRGLSFDPVGLSYLLPRLGWEFDQPSAPHSVGCAILLALGGYTANGVDMVATGLATHYVGEEAKLNLLERTLSELESWGEQRLLPDGKRLYGREDEYGNEGEERFHNYPGDGGRENVSRNGTYRGDPMHFADFKNQQCKNVAVGNVIQHLSEFDVANAGEYGCPIAKSDLEEDDYGNLVYLKSSDPSLVLPEERILMYGSVDSTLVDLAATFRDAWMEPTVHGVMERLREIAATREQYEGKKGYEEDVQVAEAAGDLVRNMERRSPLALCVTHRLLVLGSQGEETVESCMEREKGAQRRLFSKKDGDFERWAESGMGVGLVEVNGGRGLMVVNGAGIGEETFGGWNHGSVKEVTEDEILEIVGDN
ncbi:hypothetical protein ACHAXS_014452 [Conticribra weissflogii]